MPRLPASCKQEICRWARANLYSGNINPMMICTRPKVPWRTLNECNFPCHKITADSFWLWRSESKTLLSLARASVPSNWSSKRLYVIYTIRICISGSNHLRPSPISLSRMMFISYDVEVSVFRLAEFLGKFSYILTKTVEMWIVAQFQRGERGKLGASKIQMLWPVHLARSWLAVEKCRAGLFLPPDSWSLA